MNSTNLYHPYLYLYPKLCLKRLFHGITSPLAPFCKVNYQLRVSTSTAAELVNSFSYWKGSGHLMAVLKLLTCIDQRLLLRRENARESVGVA